MIEEENIAACVSSTLEVQTLFLRENRCQQPFFIPLFAHKCALINRREFLHCKV